MQSEIVPVSRYGYSSHNPTHTMPNVELPMLKSAKTRRREAWQIDILEAFYQHVSRRRRLGSCADLSQKHMPDKSEKEMLAARINDTLKYVNIWFQVSFRRHDNFFANPSQNRRQAAQKKGELQRRETYEHWRTKRQGNGSEYDELPSPDYAAAGPSYFSQSYPPHPTMLVTPNEPDECRLSPSGSNALALHAPATTSPFAFRLALPQPVAPPRKEYDRQHPYERATYTPPYTSKGLTQPAGYFADQRPGLERSVSMRREAPVYGFDLPRTSMERTLPALPPLEPPNSSTTASSALPSPRKESSGSEENSIASSTEKSPLSDLKLPPITSISLPDHMSWSSTLRTRRP
jgi:hypothetical protein